MMTRVWYRAFTCFAVFFVTVLIPPAVEGESPDLLLAEKYRQDIDLSANWVSEKLDGVRAFWDGERLISRGGNARTPTTNTPLSLIHI